ncbi:hypothetical protein BZA77DRAFT_377019 [Pyronema omphalodes]|nr:hypothetical protein BZA77DRAFT_377019 [Pyronema omphalodes]
MCWHKKVQCMQCHHTSTIGFVNCNPYFQGKPLCNQPPRDVGVTNHIRNCTHRCPKLGGLGLFQFNCVNLRNQHGSGDEGDEGDDEDDNEDENMQVAADPPGLKNTIPNVGAGMEMQFNTAAESLGLEKNTEEAVAQEKAKDEKQSTLRKKNVNVEGSSTGINELMFVVTVAATSSVVTAVSIYQPIYATSIEHGHDHYDPHHPNDPYDPHHPHHPHHLYHPYYPHHPNDPYDPHHPHHPHGPPYAPVAYGLNNPYGPPQASHDLHNSEGHSYTPVAPLTDAHSRPVILPSLWSQVNGCVPIDPRLLQIDTYQRAAQGLPPFDSRPMVLMASGLRKVFVLPVADTTATVRHKRIYGPREKPAAVATSTTRGAAPAAAKWKYKTRNESFSFLFDS